ncbi:MAG: galactitol-1-phosphate 5-dehydrogenase [Pirellulales bacterium]|nr:galactitol-1-phosphate 5-dehydrogenase [Pirellulales bacterium]
MLGIMKALLLTAPSSLTVTDLETPEPDAGEVRVRIAACGICGSDVHGYTGSTGRRIPPLVMGHEAAGIIDAVGKNVSGELVGQRVALDSTVFCGECEFCCNGKENLCTHRQVLGVSCDTYRRQGCFAEYAIVPERCVYPLPEQMGFVAASLLEPLTIGLQAVRLGNASPATRSAVVIGAGTIGLAIIVALKSYGVQRVAAVDLDASRLNEAREFGADAVFEADQITAKQLAEWGASSADTDGADLVLEAVGAAASVETAIHAVTRGGTVVLVGNVSPVVELPLQTVVTRQIRLQGSCASAGCYPEAIELAASGAVDLSRFVSRVAPLEDGIDWFERLHNREPGVLKVVLQPSEISEGEANVAV